MHGESKYLDLVQWFLKRALHHANKKDNSDGEEEIGRDEDSEEIDWDEEKENHFEEPLCYQINTQPNLGAPSKEKFA